MSILRRIERDPDEDHLRILIRNTFDAEIRSARKIGEGAYGIAHEVSLSADPGRVVVKWQKRPGRGRLEKRQLRELRKHAKVAVPAVLGYHAESEDLPFEAIIMEWIPGVPASELPAPDPPTRARFAHQVVEVLLRWHSVHNVEGYGPLDGPYCPRWIEFFRPRLEAYLAQVRADKRGNDLIAGAIRDTAERSFDHAEAIIGSVREEAVLIHSDFWLSNIIVNPDDYRITGIIDPLDAEWADSELDLIHLDLSWGGEAGLLHLYGQSRPRSELYTVRRAFYKFWYAMQNIARIGWYDEEESLGFARSLDKAMKEYL